MTAVRVVSFNGELPKLEDRVLPDEFAAYAVNCTLQAGILQGINDPPVIKSLTDRVAMYRKVWRLDDTHGGDYWFGLSDPTADLVKAPLVNDKHHRYYWTEKGQPLQYNTMARMLENKPSLIVGVPQPPTAPHVQATPNATPPTTTPPGPEYDITTRAYVFTYVTEFGEEGQPSPAGLDDGPHNGTWTISRLAQSIPDVHNRRVVKKRIYRTITALSGATVFYRVVELDDVMQDVYVDTATDGEIVGNPLLESASWATPPDTLYGLVAAPGGFLVAFSGRDVYFSEPYLPHAWPLNYVVSTEWNIVGLGVFGNTIVVMTEGAPQALTGAHPAAMTFDKSNVPEPCLNKGSIVQAPEGVYYAGANGLMLIGPGGPQNILSEVIDHEDWITRFNPKGILAARYKTGYIALTSPGKGFIVMNEQRAVFTEFEDLNAAINVMSDYRSGDIYLLANNLVYHWNPALMPRRVGLWRSKEFQVPKPVNMGAFILQMNLADVVPPPVLEPGAPPIGMPVDKPGPYIQPYPPGNPIPLVPEGQRTRVRVWGDRRLLYDQFVNDNKQRRLPVGFKAEIWQFEIATRVMVYSFMMAETGKELATV